MASNAVLRWLDGRGWLVLAGHTPSSDAIRARALSIAAADGGIAYVATQGVDTIAENLLRDMEDLGAPAGYLVDALTEDDAAIRSKLADAGMVVIGLNEDVHQLRSALLGAANEGIQIAFENGAVVLVEGPGAMVFGAWIVEEAADALSGLEWLQGVLVVPGSSSVAELPITKQLLSAQGTAIAVGIGTDSALALGPDGQVETWGEGEVSIALGPDFGA